jgi:hypothetical protein
MDFLMKASWNRFLQSQRLMDERGKKRDVASQVSQIAEG